ncbi:hypothetical protein FQZ97_1011830 [compost metagenome]
MRLREFFTARAMMRQTYAIPSHPDAGKMKPTSWPKGNREQKKPAIETITATDLKRVCSVGSQLRQTAHSREAAVV